MLLADAPGLFGVNAKMGDYTELCYRTLESLEALIYKMKPS